MSDILVVASDVALRGSNLDCAAALAGELSASLSGLYIVPPCPREYDFAPPSLAAEIIAICRQQRELAVDAARTFADWTFRKHVSSHGWRYCEGDLIDAVAGAAIWHDLVVVPRDETVPWSDAARMLVRVDVPCIVVPKQCSDFRLGTVAVAWNGSAQAARAIHSSMPLLQKARRVLLVDGSGGERPAGARAPGPAADIETHLRNRCADVTRVRLDDRASEAGRHILALASNAAADMLVMGAYGRTRFGEWVFGGATRHVLEHACLPVLFRR